VLLGRGEESPFKDGSFGPIFFIAILCFVDSPERILGEAARLLQTGGKVVLGMVLRKSPWGQLYQAKKETGHHFYRYAMLYYTYAEVEMLLMQTGLSIEKVVSTLFQNPSEVYHIESPQQGFFESAGFTVVLASKHRSR